MSDIYIGINNTKTTYTIREYPNMTNKIVGKLYPNELCICNLEDNDVIGFRNSKGELDSGKILDQVFVHESIDNLPYSREHINGSENAYLIYHMRKTMNVYRRDGSYWGKVAGGMYIATDSCTPGTEHSDWMKIRYVKSTKGEWVQVKSDDTHKFGFVDTGFSQASAGSKVALHGNW